MEKDLSNPEKKNSLDEDDDNLDFKNNSNKNIKTSSDPKKSKKSAAFFASESSEKNTKGTQDNEKSDDNSEVQNLSEDEVQEVVQIIIDEREQIVSNELAVAKEGSVEELEAVASGVFLESLRHKSLNDDEITPDIIEQAYEESVEDLDIDTEIAVTDDSFEDEDENTVITTEVANNNTQITAITPSASPSPTNPRSATSNTPPLLNTTPPTKQVSRNQNRNIVPVPMPIPLDSSTAVLTGAITGYILGRRNKKNNEKNKTVTNNKLDSQIKKLQTAIYEKESKLRDLVRKSTESNIINPNKPIFIAERRKKRIEIRQELKRREELINNPKIEKIGNFSLPALKIYRERRLPDGSENHPKRKPVEIMTVTELLEKSGHVKYEKWRIDELYKSHRITEKVLRQVTKEYMRGGPYKQTLAREVLPDPKIIAESHQKINDIHQQIDNSQSNKSNFEKSKSEFKNKEKSKNPPNEIIYSKKQPLSKNNLPLPWIAAVTAIATILAIALIYLL